MGKFIPKYSRKYYRHSTQPTVLLAREEEKFEMTDLTLFYVHDTAGGKAVWWFLSDGQVFVPWKKWDDIVNVENVPNVDWLRRIVRIDYDPVLLSTEEAIYSETGCQYAPYRLPLNSLYDPKTSPIWKSDDLYWAVEGITSISLIQVQKIFNGNRQITSVIPKVIANDDNEEFQTKSQEYFPMLKDLSMVSYNAVGIYVPFQFDLDYLLSNDLRAFDKYGMYGLIILRPKVGLNAAKEELREIIEAMPMNLGALPSLVWKALRFPAPIVPSFGRREILEDLGSAPRTSLDAYKQVTRFFSETAEFDYLWKRKSMQPFDSALYQRLWELQWSAGYGYDMEDAPPVPPVGWGYGKR